MPHDDDVEEQEEEQEEGGKDQPIELGEEDTEWTPPGGGRRTATPRPKGTKRTKAASPARPPRIHSEPADAGFEPDQAAPQHWDILKNIVDEAGFTAEVNEDWLPFYPNNVLLVKDLKDCYFPFEPSGGRLLSWLALNSNETQVRNLIHHVL